MPPPQIVSIRVSSASLSSWVSIITGNTELLGIRVGLGGKGSILTSAEPHKSSEIFIWDWLSKHGKKLMRPDFLASLVIDIVLRFSPWTNTKGRTSVVGLKLTEEKGNHCSQILTWLIKQTLWCDGELKKALSSVSGIVWEILNGHNHRDMKLQICFGQKRHKGGILAQFVVLKCVLCISTNAK